MKKQEQYRVSVLDINGKARWARRVMGPLDIARPVFESMTRCPIIAEARLEKRVGWMQWKTLRAWDRQKDEVIA